MRRPATTGWQATPVPSDDSGHEPDFRFTLANERTFLAWIRTALALLAGGIALNEIEGPFASDASRTALAALAVLLSLALAVSGYVRWRQVQQAMRHRRPLPHPWAVPLLATGIAGVAGLVALVLVFQ
jgi:putative membrane protein